MAKEKIRCLWCAENELYMRYHDEEWGVPVRDDRTLFEFLVLEGAQAGLSWLTILKKRETYRAAFAGFDPVRVARFNDADVMRLLADPGIIRNRLKINAAIKTAGLVLDIAATHGSFSEYLWSFVDGKPIHNQWSKQEQIPASTPVSDKISRELKRAGFTFVGSTIIYAFMQATGMVNDHLVDCFRYPQV